MTVPTMGTTLLLPKHNDVLTKESGISPEIIEARGYRSLERSDIAFLVAENKVSPATMKAEGWLAIPVIRPDGTKHCETIRLDKSAGKMKYIWPSGYRNALDVHPLALESVKDVKIPLIITEGVKKSDAILSHIRSSAEPDGGCVVGINGCFGWKAAVDGVVTTACADWLDIALAERRIYVIADSDYLVNNNVRLGWDECVRYLASKAGDSKVSLIVVPPNGARKLGADDYLLEHSLDELLSLARAPEQVEQSHRIIITSETVEELIATAAEDLPFLVDTILPEHSISVLAGHTESHKSWLGMCLGSDLQTGQSHFLGHPDLGIKTPANVLYINREMDKSLIQNRLIKLAATERYRGHSSNNTFRFSHDSQINLADDAVCLGLENHILEHGFNLTIFDSLSMCWSGGDENSSSEVGDMYQRLRNISQSTGCSFMFIHHFKKPGANGKSSPIFQVRGSGQIIQQADSAFMVEVAKIEGPEKFIRFTQVKSRATNHLDPFIFKVKDHDGMMTTLEYYEADSALKQQDYFDNTYQKKVSLSNWLMAEMLKHPKMVDEGIRRPTLLKLWSAAWDETLGALPSATTIDRALNYLVDQGNLLKDIDRRNGNLYRFPANEEATL